VVPAERMNLVAMYGVHNEACCGVSGTHWEYIDGVCIIWSRFMLYLAEVFFRWLRFLCLACGGLSDGHSDQQLMMIICSVWKVYWLIKLHSSLLFTSCFTDAVKLAKSSFLQFENVEPIL
jgi:hypothetical protein